MKSKDEKTAIAFNANLLAIMFKNISLYSNTLFPKQEHQ